MTENVRAARRVLPVRLVLHENHGCSRFHAWLLRTRCSSRCRHCCVADQTMEECTLCAPGSPPLLSPSRLPQFMHVYTAASLAQLRSKLVHLAIGRFAAEGIAAHDCSFTSTLPKPAVAVFFSSSSCVHHAADSMHNRTISKAQR